MRYRSRVGILCLLLSPWASTAFGQIQVVEKGATEPALPAKAAVKELQIHPKGEPEPALRYILWGSSLRTKPDNAFVHLLRAIVAYKDVPDIQKLQSNWYDNHRDASEMPLQKYPIEAARESLKPFARVLEELHAANLSRKVEYDFRLSDESLPLFAAQDEITLMRSFARLLAREARLATAEHRYEDAIKSLQAGIRIGEMTPKIGSRALISGLMAIGIYDTMLEEIKIIAQQPDAPNMYWALASLPDDFGNMRDVTEGELEAVDSLLHSVMQLPKESITDEAWQQRVVSAIVECIPMPENRDGSKDVARAKLIAGLVLLAQGPSAKASLIAHGHEAGDVDRMSYSEAVVRTAHDEMEVIKSDLLKGMLLESGLPYESKRDFLEAPLSPAKLLAQNFFRPMDQARVSGQKMLTTRNQLITVEAIRAYAAANQGKMPASLEQLKPLAAWSQVIVSGPFEYQRISDSEALLKHKPIFTWLPETAEIRLKIQSK